MVFFYFNSYLYFILFFKGISSYFDAFDQNIKMNGDHKNYVWGLLFDEMYINDGVIYIPESLQLVGFTKDIFTKDFENFHEENGLNADQMVATQVMVCMLVCVNGGISFPLAFYHTRKASEKDVIFKLIFLINILNNLY
jgi:ABC-type phosphate/phosphonate transport system permease subunit